jgi:hypothetical protein
VVLVSVISFDKVLFRWVCGSSSQRILASFVGVVQHIKTIDLAFFEGMLSAAVPF